jgi:hypothetical protein
MDRQIEGSGDEENGDHDSAPSCSQRSNASEWNGGRGERVRRHEEIAVPNSVTDYSKFPFPMSRFFHCDRLMVPPLDLLRTMDSQSRSFSMESPTDLPEYSGAPISFVWICNNNLPKQLLEVLYFWDIIQAMSVHFPWTGFVVPTSNLQDNLQLTTVKKHVTGVQRRRERETGDVPSLGSKRGVDLTKLLISSECNTSGVVYDSLPLISISVNYTAAVYNRSTGDDESDADCGSELGGESDQDEYYMCFGVVTIRSLVNVDLMKLIMVTIAVFVILFSRSDSPLFCFTELLSRVPHHRDAGV